MISDGGNSGFIGFGLLSLWVSNMFFFLVLLRMGFLVFDFFVGLVVTVDCG